MSARTGSNTIPWVFLGCSLMLLIVLGGLIAAFPKGELHLMLCDHHTPFWDAVIPPYSDMDKWLPYTLVIVLIFYKAGWASFLAADMLLTTAIVQPLKYYFFALRPVVWFNGAMPEVCLPQTPGVTMHEVYSFPSGHATDFFFIAFTLALIVKNDSRQMASYNGTLDKTEPVFEFLLFVFAAFGAYTRIYMSQHFAWDVFIGIIIALVCTLALWFIAKKWFTDTPFWAWKPRFRKK